MADKRAVRILTVGHSYVVPLNRRMAHEILRAGGGRWDVTVASPEAIWDDLRPATLERLAGEPCALEPVRAHWVRSRHLWWYGRRLRELLREPWDLVYAWEEPYILAGWQVARWTRAGTPLVYRTFQNIVKRYPPPFLWFERASLRRAAWIASGRTVEETMLARGWGDRPWRTIPVGVDTEAFRPDPRNSEAARRELGFEEPEAPIVGFVGRFVPEKGVRLLCEALERVRTPWRSLWVGEGPLLAELQSFAGRHPGRVRIATGVRHHEVPKHLAAMDLAILPSLTTPRWREQFGRTIVEAMASGVPVVGSDSGEIPHVIGDAGVVVPEGAPEDWTRALGDLLESPDRRLELARRGLERAHRLFAWPVVAKRHLEFFEHLVEAPSGRSGESLDS